LRLEFATTRHPLAFVLQVDTTTMTIHHGKHHAVRRGYLIPLASVYAALYGMASCAPTRPIASPQAPGLGGVVAMQASGLERVEIRAPSQSAEGHLSGQTQGSHSSSLCALIFTLTSTMLLLDDAVFSKPYQMIWRVLGSQYLHPN